MTVGGMGFIPERLLMMMMMMIHVYIFTYIQCRRGVIDSLYVTQIDIFCGIAIPKYGTLNVTCSRVPHAPAHTPALNPHVLYTCIMSLAHLEYPCYPTCTLPVNTLPIPSPVTPHLYPTR